MLSLMDFGVITRAPNMQTSHISHIHHQYVNGIYDVVDDGAQEKKEEKTQGKVGTVCWIWMKDWYT